jgi:membrane protein DedA with SNARE-associated domain
MNEILQHLARHGYSVLFATVFARQICLPVPAILLLLAAGALAGNGKLNLALVVGLGMVGCVLADLVWYEAGRRRGDDVVHFIHRFSSKSDSHAVRTKQLFGRYGLKVLVISKFVIGLDAIAPPLAGMSGASPQRFLFFDMVGATLWAGVYSGLGFIFYQQLDKAAAYAERTGIILTAVVILLVAVLIGRRLVHWYRFVQELRLARITPEQLKQNPFLGRSGPETGVRELVIAGTPYVVMYRVRGKRIIISTIWHGAQQREP